MSIEWEATFFWEGTRDGSNDSPLLKSLRLYFPHQEYIQEGAEREDTTAISFSAAIRPTADSNHQSPFQ
jgi:hypothetical protein